MKVACSYFSKLRETLPSGVALGGGWWGWVCPTGKHEIRTHICDTTQDQSSHLCLTETYKRKWKLDHTPGDYNTTGKGLQDYQHESVISWINILIPIILFTRLINKISQICSIAFLLSYNLVVFWVSSHIVASVLKNTYANYVFGIMYL
jgi:hypothetical protein